MNTFQITLDGQLADAHPGDSLLQVARRAGVDIPTLCYLEKCGPLNTCQVCLVKVNGRLVPSCGTKAESGMVVESETEEVHEARRTALELLFSDHVGDCLSPCHRLCPLHLNIPLMIRQIEGVRLKEAVATVRQALPLAAVLGRLCHHPCEQGCRRGNWDDPAAIREMERYVADWDLGLNAKAATQSEDAVSLHPDPLPRGEGTSLSAILDSSARTSSSGAQPSQLVAPRAILPLPNGEGRGEGEGDHRNSVDPTDKRNPQSSPGVTPALPKGSRDDCATLTACKPSTGKSVAVIGAGPAGLTAAWHLARQGHAVTIVDRHGRAGGKLREVPEAELPGEVLDREIALLEKLGIHFKLGVELGSDVRLEGLRRGFEAILLATGELTREAAEFLGVATAPTGVKADPNASSTNLPGVFATGAAVKPVKQLIRAMAEGRAAAECVDQFLRGNPPRRPEKTFSSVMGRLAPGELKQFLRADDRANRVSPCDACAGFNHREAASEAERCLHCDCRSSGECVLQHWANVYSANANRFRSERRPFEQHRQPGGILFEPGKCILCGICVKLCEMAAEPLGLTFVGRGFDVRVAAPFDEAIDAGLQKVAAECVEHCPTGALVAR